jgi:thymidylate synthase
MRIIQAECVDDALHQGITLLLAGGVKADSRNGPVLVLPYPVMTVNENPRNRVLFSAQRDANPFFHLNEALWMLAGRDDAKWLDQFVGNFSERFAEKRDDRYGGDYLHGAYGFRWRKHFDLDGGGEEGISDQLEIAVNMLRRNPDERRAVITMWDPMADLDADKKDLPCNTHIYCRVRDDVYPDYGGGPPGPGPASHKVLDLTVCCRSNDVIWGAHGANAVHFSILQEYLAAKIGVGVGKLYQLSNNYHGYLSVLEPMLPFSEIPNLYKYWSNSAQKIETVVTATPVISNPSDFEIDLLNFFHDDWQNFFYHTELVTTAGILRKAYQLWRKREYTAAYRLVTAGSMGDETRDWIVAAREWFSRRLARMNVKLEGDQNANG